MSVQQQSILRQSEKLASSFSIIKIVIFSVVYTGIITLVFWLLQIEIEILHIGAILFIMFIYFFVKDWIMLRQAQKTIQVLYDFSANKWPNQTLFVPVIGKNGWLYYLKRTALIIHQEQLFLDAYDIKSMRNGPMASVTLPFGKDFVVQDVISDSKKPYLRVKSKIKGQDYDFFVVKDDTIIRYLTVPNQPIEKEVS